MIHFLVVCSKSNQYFYDENPTNRSQHIILWGYYMNKLFMTLYYIPKWIQIKINISDNADGFK